MGCLAFAAAYDPRFFCADTLGVRPGKRARWIDCTGYRRAGRRAGRQLTPAQSIRVTGQRGDGNDSDECKD
jgi:single-stranded DNA-binding protein